MHIDWVTEWQTDCYSSQCLVSCNSFSLWCNNLSHKQYIIQNGQHSPSCQRTTLNTIRAAHIWSVWLTGSGILDAMLIILIESWLLHLIYILNFRGYSLTELFPTEEKKDYVFTISRLIIQSIKRKLDRLIVKFNTIYIFIIYCIFHHHCALYFYF